MTSEQVIQRARLLLQQRRADAAERELRGALAQDINNAELHMLLSLCMTQQDKLTEASELADRAIALDPENHDAFYASAIAMVKRNRFKEALDRLNRGIELFPFDSRSIVLRGDIRNAQQDYKGALADAELALSMDGQDQDAMNLRASALTRLGRREEAARTIRGALENDPHDSYTHANQGWAMLHQNDPKKAMEHFGESLRLDPGNEWARQGLVESLRARNFIYRWLLQYFLFMGRQSSTVQFVVIVGGFIGYRMLWQAWNTNPELGVVFVPLILAYVVFALTCWLGPALMDLILRFSKFGRYALSPMQRWRSNVVLAGLTLMAGAAAAGFLDKPEPWFPVAIVLLISTINSNTIFLASAKGEAFGWPRRVLVAAVLGLLGVGLYSVLVTTSPMNLFNVFVYGSIALQLFGPGLASTQVKR
jgi:tetratricopeptide (TPR) repeat protein